MFRNEVFDKISQERDYQERNQTNPKSHIVEDFNLGDALTAIDYNLGLAKSSWYHNQTPHRDAMEYMRKIAAICVSMGEKYEMPQRKIPPHEA